MDQKDNQLRGNSIGLTTGQGDDIEQPDSKQDAETVCCYEDLAPVQSYITRIGAHFRALDTAVIKVKDGHYPVDHATVKFVPDGSILVKPDWEDLHPTEAECIAIKVDVIEHLKLPKPIFFGRPLTREMLVNAPIGLRNAAAANIFDFYDSKGRGMMLQTRIDKPDGTKDYLPWTPWSDGKWREKEPSASLPFYGMNWLLFREPGEIRTVFLHEGAKAARFASSHRLKGVQHIAIDHPWYADLCKGEHLGWIGGAKSPHRSDWKDLGGILQKNEVERVIVVLDNDEPGLAAIRTIARNIRLPVFALRFPRDWSEGFDIADPFPDKTFKDNKGIRNYCGPGFDDCLHAATWATNVVWTMQGKKRAPKYSVRPEFARQWAYVANTEQFVNRLIPSIALRPGAFLNAVAAFSDAPSIARMLLEHYEVHCHGFCFRPGGSSTNSEGGRLLFNTWRPTDIRPVKEDVKPFLEFLAYLFPIEHDRREVERWFATLIARPEVRMVYSLLLISCKQGVGKDTFATIAGHLVGRSNVSKPSADLVVSSQFNGWLIDKTLVIVSEIYQGHSWKAYNKLQPLITEMAIEANLKNVKTFTTDLRAHFILCSNSLQCLKIAEHDRRYLVPEVAEEPWPREKFESFYAWLFENQGLGKIYNWCLQQTDFVHAGEDAPKTPRKDQMIEASLSSLMLAVDDLAEELLALDVPVALTSSRVLEHLWEPMHGPNVGFVPATSEIWQRLRDRGVFVTCNADRVKIGGTYRVIVMNCAAVKKTEEDLGVKLQYGRFIRGATGLPVRPSMQIAGKGQGIAAVWREFLDKGLKQNVAVSTRPVDPFQDR